MSQPTPFVYVTFWSYPATAGARRLYKQTIVPLTAIAAITATATDSEIAGEMSVVLESGFVPREEVLGFKLDYVGCQIPAEWISGTPLP